MADVKIHAVRRYNEGQVVFLCGEHMHRVNDEDIVINFTRSENVDIEVLNPNGYNNSRGEKFHISGPEKKVLALLKNVDYYGVEDIELF